MEKKAGPPETGKTILVVDGSLLVRQLVAAVLSYGDSYTILIADSGPRALWQSRDFEGEIHLLVTGFRLSGMSGIELATAMTVDRPKLIVVIMSVFPEDMLAPNDQWHFLSKPFIASQLRALVARLMYPD